MNGANTRSWGIVGLAALAAGLSCSRTGPDHAQEARLVTAQAATPPQRDGGVTPKTQPPSAAEAVSQAFESVAAALRPSVVRIDVEMKAPRGAHAISPEEFFRRFFQFGPEEGEPELPAPGPTHALGSGFVFDKSGVIVTNRHVVSDATSVKVTLSDGRELDARIVGSDRWTDVAVVRLAKPPAGLVVARLGDSDKLKVGQWVLAVGSPLGLEQTVTAGIVSGLGRVGGAVQMSGERVRRYIETDAKINPGNSGGPLVNLASEVVGMNTLINTGPGGAYGFAIPINQVRSVVGDILKEGRVRYPYLGVRVGSVKDLTAEERAKLGPKLPDRGAVVASVSPDGPAAKAGVKPGDVVVAIDGKNVETAGDVIDTVATKQIGAKVVLDLMRQGNRQKVEVTLGELPSGPAPGTRIGISLQTVTPDLDRMLGIEPTTKGAVITEVAGGSPGDKAGLVPGDVIVEVDRKPVASAEEALSALQQPTKTGEHLLRVRNAKGTRFVTVKP